MSPDSFWRSTISDINEMLEGYKIRNDEAMHKLAWAVSHIMNSTGRYKRQITPDKLLGKQKKYVEIIPKKLQSAEIKKIADEFEEVRKRNQNITLRGSDG